jgi:tRNA 2-thiocytidine biosynthesis protein TtcA
MSRSPPIRKLERRLLNRTGKAIKEYALINDGDRIMVALSGGKDSYALLSLLDRLKERAPIGFELVPWHLDQAQPGYDGAPLRDWLEARGGEFHIASHDTYSIVIDKIDEGGTYCSLCSRLRRGIMYNAAVELGCNKIALGHHGDDAIETLLLNLLFTGRIKAMPPWLRSDDERNVVIRPMITCFERDLAAYAEQEAFPVLPCGLCNNQENLKRQAIKVLIGELEKEYPRARESMLSSLTRVASSHLLDSDLWRRLGIGPEGLPDKSAPPAWSRLQVAQDDGPA